MRMGDDSWGVAGSDRVPQCHREGKEKKQLKPLCPAFFRAMEHGTDGRCLYMCGQIRMHVIISDCSCASLSVTLSGLELCHCSLAALPVDDGLLTPYRDRHWRF